MGSSPAGALAARRSTTSAIHAIRKHGFRETGGYPVSVARDRSPVRGRAGARALRRVAAETLRTRERGSRVRDPAPSLLPPRLLVNGRATPARFVARTPLSRDPGPSRHGGVAGASNLPRPCAFPRAAPGCPGGALPVGLREENPRCGAPEVLSVAGPPLERMGRPLFRTPSLEKRGYRPSACSISARHPLHGRCDGVGEDSTYGRASSLMTTRSG